MENIKIITLQPDDWQLYRDLRLRALKEEAHAFLSTYADNLKRPDEYWRDRVQDALDKNTQWLIFAELDNKLVGMMGAFAERDIKDAHIISVYVTPEARGNGISKLMMNDLLRRIKTNKNIKKISVDVNPEQEAAYKLYKNSGFSITQKYRLVLGDGKEHDVYSLEMILDN